MLNKIICPIPKSLGDINFLFKHLIKNNLDSCKGCIDIHVHTFFYNIKKIHLNLTLKENMIVSHSPPIHRILTTVSCALCAI